MNAFIQSVNKHSCKLKTTGILFGKQNDNKVRTEGVSIRCDSIGLKIYIPFIPLVLQIDSFRDHNRYRKGQKVLVHILQELFHFKHFQGRDVEQSASKQAEITGNIAATTNSMYEECFGGDINAKNGNESYLRLSPERSVRTENSYSKTQ